MTDKNINEIKKVLENNSNQYDLDEILRLNNKIEDLYEIIIR